MRVGPGLQCPAPSQTDDPTTASPSHMPGLHMTFTGYLRQPPRPSHLPSSPQVAAGIFTQALSTRGFSPDDWFTHCPSEVGALQTLHPSVQALLQQTPSAQNPLPHSRPHLQGSPSALVPATQGPLSGASPRSGAPSPPGPTSILPPSEASGFPEPELLQPIAPSAKTTKTNATSPDHPAPVRTNFIMDFSSGETPFLE